jgi:hypothetical protein
MFSTDKNIAINSRKTIIQWNLSVILIQVNPEWLNTIPFPNTGTSKNYKFNQIILLLRVKMNSCEV